MTTYVSVASLALVLMFAAAPLRADTRWSHYRGVTLGDSMAAAEQRLDVAGTGKVLFTAPALVHELTWRPHRFISGVIATPDPLAELVMTFMNDRLVRMVAIYDRDRTAGLTDADFIELLTQTYGAPLLASRGLGGVRNDPRPTIGSWGDDSVLVRLWTEMHPRRVGLTITSLDETALQAASAGAATLERDSAPARAAARQAAAETARKQLEEKTRLANKANFKP